MELPIKSITNQNKGTRKLPIQFGEPVRPDLIKRAVLAVMSTKRQAYGAKPEAGQRASAKLSRRRRDYKTSYGLGISRVPRKVLSRRGTRMNWVGAVAPGTVGGRRAHPPKGFKKWEHKINRKEKRKAIRSCLAATMSKDWIEKRIKEVPKEFPFLLEDRAEEIKSTKELAAMLKACGIELSHEKKVRVGKGKLRGRRYRSSRGLLIVVAKDCPLMKAARNLLGVEVSRVNQLNAEILAPGAQPGRLALYTEGSIERIEKEKIFV
jgi:large subunit ribosomal protein L4e